MDRLRLRFLQLRPLRPKEAVVVNQRRLGRTAAARENVSFGLELWEQDYIPDAFLTQQHHAKAVNTQAHAAGGRHPVLQSGQKILIQLLLFAPGLMLQALALLDGIVLFAVSRSDLLAVDTTFKYVDGGGVIGSELGQRDEFLGGMCNKGGVDHSWLDQLLKNRLRDFEIDIIGAQLRTEFQRTLPALASLESKPIGACSLADNVFVFDALPGRRQVDRFDYLALGVLVLNKQRPQHFAGNVANHVLHQFHHGLVIAIGLIGFEHRELRIMFA